MAATADAKKNTKIALTTRHTVEFSRIAHTPKTNPKGQNQGVTNIFWAAPWSNPVNLTRCEFQESNPASRPTFTSKGAHSSVFEHPLAGDEVVDSTRFVLAEFRLSVLPTWLVKLTSASGACQHPSALPFDPSGGWVLSARTTTIEKSVGWDLAVRPGAVR